MRPSHMPTAAERADALARHLSAHPEPPPTLLTVGEATKLWQRLGLDLKILHAEAADAADTDPI